MGRQKLLSDMEEKQREREDKGFCPILSRVIIPGSLPGFGTKKRNKSK